MAEKFLPPELDKPQPVMRIWKWIGLAVFTIAILLSPWLPGIVVGLACLYGVLVIVNLLFILFRRLKNRVFWSVRNRIIGAFVFVGLIPMLVILGVIYLSLRMLLGQLAANYLGVAFIEAERELSSINAELAQQIAPGSTSSALDRLASHTFQNHAAQFPRLAARLVQKRQDGTFETVWKYDPHGIVTMFEQYPADKWLGANPFFEGLLREDATLLMTTLRPLAQAPNRFLDLSAPVDANVEQRLEREKSIYLTMVGIGATDVRVSNTGIKITTNKNDKPKVEADAEQGIKSMVERRRRDPRRMITWGVPLDATNFSSGKKNNAGIAVVSVPLVVLWDHYLKGSSQLGGVLLKIIYILLGIFVVAEVISLIIGGTISRRITRSTYDMYQGTLALQKGDLQHRIPVRRNDQLGMLAHSFNQMSASIVQLLVEVTEKKRLEQELEIAREVQATLFPRQLPHSRGLAVFGGCEPAQVVSGDYYDFVVQDEARLNIIVGDISGKGISAALLMANLQAAMRNQLMSIKHGSPADVERNIAEVMIQLNQQIYSNSPSEKYATLFLSRFDADSHRLYFCNAGHLPPILLINGTATRLEAGGTVLGLFPSVQYSSSSIELLPGTVLAIFTDGITEAVNHSDEEFGEERLIETLQEARARAPEAIYQHVIARVQLWQGSLKQHDDITLIVAKVE